MDNTMPSNDDFLKPLLDMMNKRMDGLDAKMDANTALTQQTLEKMENANGRITNTENAIKRLEGAKGKKLNVNPQLIYVLALGTLILLTIIASLLHVNLRGIL